MKEKNQSTSSASSAEAQGLHLDKKTILFIMGVILAILLFVGILTQVVPRGEYLRDADGVIIAQNADGSSTYHTLNFKLPFWKTFTAPIEVFGSSDALTGVAIILFIILIGGTFLILNKSGVLSFIMSSVVHKYAGRKYFLIAAVVFIMMALSSVVGILEESITIVPLCVAISLALGWDSLVGLSISLIAIAFGYSAATFNPFNVVLVQSMAGLPIFSGLGYRLLVFLGVYAILTAFVITYAKRIEKNPAKSIVYETDLKLREQFAMPDEDITRDPKMKKATRIFVGKLIEESVPLESISPLKNSAIQQMIYDIKRSAAVNLAGIEKGLKTGAMGGKSTYIPGREIDLPIVENGN